MSEKVVTFNRKALHDYHVLETVEAGLVLTGTEIKSIRDGRVNLREAFARAEDGELWLHNMHIAQYPAASHFNHEPTRKRKLLLHRSQIGELSEAINEKGLTIVPLRLYLKRGRAKVEIALARGRRVHDKRQKIAEREAERQITRALHQR
jgi:SsrA-binding protein